VNRLLADLITFFVMPAPLRRLDGLLQAVLMELHPGYIT